MRWGRLDARFSGIGPRSSLPCRLESGVWPPDSCWGCRESRDSELAELAPCRCRQGALELPAHAPARAGNANENRQAGSRVVAGPDYRGGRDAAARRRLHPVVTDPVQGGFRRGCLGSYQNSSGPRTAHLLAARRAEGAETERSIAPL